MTNKRLGGAAITAALFFTTGPRRDGAARRPRGGRPLLIEEVEGLVETGRAHLVVTTAQNPLGALRGVLTIVGRDHP